MELPEDRCRSDHGQVSPPSYLLSSLDPFMFPTPHLRRRFNSLTASTSFAQAGTRNVILLLHAPLYRLLQLLYQ
jgi:hypothetical protein